MRLKTLDFMVVALDKSPETIQAARQLGLDAVLSDFIDYDATSFEVILFTHSLHHIHPLSKALDHAYALLKPSGLLIAEEFAVEIADRETTRWNYEIQSLLEAAELLTPEENQHSWPDDPLERWKAEHAETPPLHSGDTMLREIRSRFEPIQILEAPYLWRYIYGRLEKDTKGYRLGKQVLDLEQKRIHDGAIRPVGLRIVVRRAK